MTARHIRILLMTAAFAAGLVLCFGIVLIVTGRLSTPGAQQVAAIGGPFKLTDQNGKVVTDQDLKGRPTLVFFGFTNCPDVCPTALQVMAAALDKLGPNAERITPVLISVDPEHDTPALLAAYVASFHPRLVGLTGSPAEIDAVAKAYRVYVKKVADPKSTAGYTIDHSSIIYVVGPDGAYRTHFTHATTPDGLADRLAGMLQRPTM